MFNVSIKGNPYQKEILMKTPTQSGKNSSKVRSKEKHKGGRKHYSQAKNEAMEYKK